MGRAGACAWNWTRPLRSMIRIGIGFECMSTQQCSELATLACFVNMSVVDIGRCMQQGMHQTDVFAAKFDTFAACVWPKDSDQLLLRCAQLGFAGKSLNVKGLSNC